MCIRDRYYGTWYYVQNGILNWDYTGLTKYYGTWYYVENGVLNGNYTGLTKYYDTCLLYTSYLPESMKA